jgi:hypothetical protein
MGASTGTQNGMANNLANVNTSTAGLNSVNAMLQQQTMGQGNVQQASQAQLQNATNQGVANATGVVANTKGLNPAMAARMAGQNAAQSTQQGANASAALTAQNALSSQQVLSQNLNNQYNTAQGGYNASNSANGGANTAAEQGQIGAESGGLMGSGAAASMMANGGTVRMYDDGGQVLPALPDVPQAADSNTPSTFSPNRGNGATAVKALALMSDGGNVQTPSPIFGNAPSSSSGSTSYLSKFMSGFGSQGGSKSSDSSTGMPSAYQGAYNLAMGIFGGGKNAAPQPAATAADSSPTPQSITAGNDNPDPSPMAKGGRVKSKGRDVPAMVSPGERYLPPNAVKEVAKGKKDPMKAGEKIPGKAKVPGNSLANDIVPKTLKEGGIVLPRTVTESKHPHWEAMKFVKAHMNKLKMGK